MLIDSLLKKDKRAAARLISQIENGTADADTLKTLHEKSNNVHIVGITGPPGTGKSTLVAALTKEYRKAGKNVGILAIDPTSPFSGGAILGDRIRMTELTMDEGVFIRSFATRGYSGGLCAAVLGAVKVLDVYGMDVVFIETVGAGQDEVDIYKIAHTNVVVISPGSGDDIQILKAGILEIADIFVVNKADHEGAGRVAIEIESGLETKKDWKSPVLKTVALKDEGINEVLKAIEQHYDYLKSADELALRDRRRTEFEITELLNAELRKRLELKHGSEYSKLIDEVIAKKRDPHSTAREMLRRLAG
jgi:LAO/AO transport system kinase